MYPRFLKLFLNNQIENLAAVFNDEYDTPSHTKKVFANMRMKGKDFSGTVTALFPSMLALQAVEGEGSGQPTEPQHTPTTASPSHSSEPNNLDADKVVHEERGDSVERAATTAASLDAQQDIGDTISQTRSERVSTPSYDSPLLGVNTPESDEERIELKELMDIKEFNEAGKEGTSQELQQQNRLGHKPRVESSKKGALVDEHMFDLSDLAGTEETTELVEDKCSAEKGVGTAEDKDSNCVQSTTCCVADDVTLAETLMTIRSSASSNKNKGKGIMQEPEKPVKVKGKYQIEYYADMAQRLQAELDEEVRLEREREEEASNAALIEEWDSIEARIDADAQLAESLQAEEREQMSVEEQARLLMEFIAARKKFFAVKKAEEQRNKLPTKAEQRKKMCTYMKHMAGYKDKNFKGKSFDAIKQMFDKAY
ncbi:hypothetical protein Tco_0893307 [Tanacetum coccineum]|uniref:Uncharacterized protein n=1 Tax=Tanacetum coccineum TaxID=301880 RepID=A0ABQ5C8H4_9ASTR